ncbi:MAG: pyruvate kinase [[Clostridium] aminophilum]|uniref:pyruvate kinase n=1 Tax=[Clostridium] aminophilum TaxID=1526 RepID=UPI0026EE5001|nr:pyruvate kinase [[Clostridium] aminophilum]MDD6196006.1 pyruvate kinase [[Clostridium] aminophilum]
MEEKQSMKRTKIVCTMGPNEDDYELMYKMCASNMDVARFNFSHGTHQEQADRLDLLRRAAKEANRPIAALLDTKGPEIRTGLLKDGKKVLLEAGKEITLTTEECTGTAERVFINYNGLNDDVKAGDTILIDDGLIGLRVISVDGADIRCTIVNGGELGERKGVNVPNVSIHLPDLTDKDIEDIKFGIKEGFDIIAASFVRSASCIRQIRGLLEEAGANMLIIAKIENQEGLDNLDEIIAEADGIMVARGDLGVEIEAQYIPHLQKKIIRKCNEAGKVVITATQMLDSMIRNPRPTRAEVTDVANAVYDGTDAVMLSGETAAGKYPFEALSMMADVVENAEKYLHYDKYMNRDVSDELFSNIANTICASSVTAANELNAVAIITPTISGSTARLISKYRPKMKILALSPSQAIVRQMMLYWGVTPIWTRRAETTDELLDISMDELKNTMLINEGDICVVTSGVLSRAKNSTPASATNIMRIMQV